jgi:aspartate dehydrogenase
VPSGAVGALDVVAAAARAGLEAVVVEQRKPPHTLLPPEEASSLRAPRVLFDGPVGDVVARYPTTTNVAAAVALAGIGFERTRALVVADPALQANRVVLRASGTAGTFRFELDNVASANPKTSGIVAYSVLGTIARLLDPLAVPA